MLEIRKNITSQERHKAAARAGELFIQSRLFLQSQHIACYYAQKYEFDCGEMIKAIWRYHKNCYLPILTEQDSGSLLFVRYEENDTLQANRYRILEPQDKTLYPLDHLDVVLVPFGWDFLVIALLTILIFYFVLTSNMKHPIYE